jgi:alpha-2-macroglobulin
VEVRLTVIAPTDAYYLVAEDPLPAGLEAVNGSLQTTGLTERLDARPRPADTGKGGDAEGPPATGAQFFDNVEMRDDRAVLYASYLPAGVYEYRYLARATTPGVYTARPAEARLTYLPDVWGRSDSAHFEVTDSR